MDCIQTLRKRMGAGILLKDVHGVLHTSAGPNPVVAFAKSSPGQVNPTSVVQQPAQADSGTEGPGTTGITGPPPAPANTVPAASSESVPKAVPKPPPPPVREPLQSQSQASTETPAGTPRSAVSSDGSWVAQPPPPVTTAVSTATLEEIRTAYAEIQETGDVSSGVLRNGASIPRVTGEWTPLSICLDM